MASDRVDDASRTRTNAEDSGGARVDLGMSSVVDDRRYQAFLAGNAFQLDHLCKMHSI